MNAICKQKTKFIMSFGEWKGEFWGLQKVYCFSCSTGASTFDRKKKALLKPKVGYFYCGKCYIIQQMCIEFMDYLVPLFSLFFKTCLHFSHSTRENTN